MAEVQFVERTLFGEWEAENAESSGEAFVGRHILTDWDDMRSRAEWCMENLPYTGNLLLEEEDLILLRECMSSYIFGLYSLSIISADAFLERIITDTVETYGKKSASFGFGKTLSAFRKLGIVENCVFQRIQYIHSIRNNFVHEKGPDGEMRISRRALSRRVPGQYLLKTDAQEAICLAHGLARILLRNFPRLRLPELGTPTLYRSPYKQ